MKYHLEIDFDWRAVIARSLRQTKTPDGLAWQRNPDEKREKILAAARHLFLSQGLAATKLSDVAIQADVSVGLIYHYYDNKAGLLAAVAEQYSQAMVQAMFNGDLEDDVPGVEPIIKNTFEFVHDRGALISRFDQDGAIRGAARGIHREIICAALQAWLNKHFQEIKDPELTAVLLYGMVASALDRCFVVDQAKEILRWQNATAQAVNAVLERTR